MQNWSSVEICSHCIHIFARLAPICMLQSMLTNKTSAAEISRKFIKTALLVGQAKKTHVCSNMQFLCQQFLPPSPGGTERKGGRRRSWTTCKQNKGRRKKQDSIQDVPKRIGILKSSLSRIVAKAGKLKCISVFLWNILYMLMPNVSPLPPKKNACSRSMCSDYLSFFKSGNSFLFPYCTHYFFSPTSLSSSSRFKETLSFPHILPDPPSPPW